MTLSAGTEKVGAVINESIKSNLSLRNSGLIVEKNKSYEREKIV